MQTYAYLLNEKPFPLTSLTSLMVTNAWGSISVIMSFME